MEHVKSFVITSSKVDLDKETGPAASLLEVEIQVGEHTLHEVYGIEIRNGSNSMNISTYYSNDSTMYEQLMGLAKTHDFSEQFCEEVLIEIESLKFTSLCCIGIDVGVDVCKFV